MRTRFCRSASRRAGRVSRRLAAMAAVLTVIAAGGSAVVSASASAAPSLAWKLKLAIHYLPPVTNRSQYDAVVSEPGKTWLFGGSDVGGHGKAEIERISKGVPHAVSLPAGAHSWITAASAPSPSNIWAVTYLSGTVLHWDGSKWAAVPRGGWKAGTRFTGITAVSPSDVWVFGTKGHLYAGAGTWHLSGSTWTRVRGVAAGIIEASRAGPSDLWAIGNAGAPRNGLFHLGAASWRRMKPAALTGFRYSSVLALGVRDVWVAGSVSGTPKLGHYDGHSWTLLRMPGTTVASGMCKDGRGGMWVIANSGASPSAVLDRSSAGIWKTAVVSDNVANKILACTPIAGTQQSWGAGQAAAPHGTAAAAYRYG